MCYIRALCPPHSSFRPASIDKNCRKMGPYMKFLTGDYLTYLKKYENTNQGNPLCKICHTGNESVCHILAICPEYEDIRNRILSEISQLCLLAKIEFDFTKFLSDPEVLTQFLLDPTSFNLTERVHVSDPIVTHMFKLSRDICWAIHSKRMKTLKLLNENQTTTQ